jgi:hypothetical protein
MNKPLHPVVATVFAMGAFLVASITFNIIFQIAALIHIDRFLSGFLQGILLLAVSLLLGPLSIQATRSRVRPQLVAFTASLLLGVIYIVAVRLHVVFLTHGLFPHIPGKEVYADTGTGIIFLIVVIAGCVTIATLMSNQKFGLSARERKTGRGPSRRGTPRGATRPRAGSRIARPSRRDEAAEVDADWRDEAAEVGADVGEGIGEGIYEQIQHLHHH